MATPYSDNDIQCRGYCIVINNSYNESDPTLIDVKSMFENELNFHVQIYTKISADGIMQLLSSVAKVKHEKYDCLVIIVCSEGKKGKYVYGADGAKIRVNDIITTFASESCPSLKNKAKVFLMETTVRETNLQSPLIQQPCEVNNDKIDNWHIHSVVYAGQRPDNTFFHYLVQKIHSSFDFSDVLQTALQDVGLNNQNVVFHSCPMNITPLLFSKKIQEGIKYMEQGQILAIQLEMALEIWRHMRESTVEYLEEIRDKLKQVCQYVRASRAGGGATSIVGGVFAVAGLALIPVTLGGSLGLTVAGAAVGVAGGVTSIGAILAKIGICKAKLKKVEEIIEVDKQLSVQVNELSEKLEAIATELLKAHDNPNVTREEVIVSLLQGGKFLRMGLAATRTGVSVSQVAKAGGTAAVQGAILAGRITGAAARVVAVAAVGGVVSVLILPLDIYELVSNSYKLSQNSVSRAVELIDEQLVLLKQERDNLQEENNLLQDTGLDEYIINSGLLVQHKINVCASVNIENKLDLIRLLSPIEYKWRQLGEGLKISHGDLENIQIQRNYNADRLADVIQFWIDKRPSEVTWHNIITAVDLPPVHEPSIAERIRDIYVSSYNL